MTCIVTPGQTIFISLNMLTLDGMGRNKISVKKVAIGLGEGQLTLLCGPLSH